MLNCAPDLPTVYLTIPVNGRRAAGKSTRGASRSTSDIWTAPPDPTSVHAKRAKMAQVDELGVDELRWISMA